MQLNNTVGIVDSDYFGARNEGHIFIKLTNAGDRLMSVGIGEAFAQGVFIPFGLTDDDDASGERTGGFGSTGRREASAMDAGFPGDKHNDLLQ